jgi:hypothetical protein
MLHLVLHFLVPAFLSFLLFRKNWMGAFLIMIATMFVDVDHLLANPMYDPGRCSIGFHPLHKLWFIIIYVVLCFVPKARLVGLGLTVHMVLDAIDCQVTNGVWINQSL